MNFFVPWPAPLEIAVLSNGVNLRGKFGSGLSGLGLCNQISADKFWFSKDRNSEAHFVTYVLFVAVYLLKVFHWT